MNFGRYILVAEDDVDANYLLNHAFRQANPQVPVVYTEDGRQAIDYLQGKEAADPREFQVPVILLLDLKMPRMDGFEVLQWLQHCPALRPECIVVLTSSPAPADIDRARELGADFYVVKPLGVPELLEITGLLVSFCQTGHWPGKEAKGLDRMLPLRA